MNILCIIHADFETPGVIETWASNNKYSFQICSPYTGDTYLNQNNFDFLIVMGGPQSPLELEKDPYLLDEIDLIKRAIYNDKLVLGFCLGAQLIGEALGAKTMKSPEKEVGVYPITLSKAGQEDPILQNRTQVFPVIHWHNDMPGLTSDATVLAESEGCPRQIVRYTSKVYGFQCHLEIDLAGIKTMIEACPNDLRTSKYTQTLPELLEQDYDSINQMMFEILDRFVLLKSNANEKLAI